MTYPKEAGKEYGGTDRNIDAAGKFAFGRLSTWRSIKTYV